jgi:hypothetical protein
VANGTQVLLGTVPLQPSGAAAPAAGQFSVNTAGTALTLVPPAELPAGTYQIRVRVAGIESDPALWLAAVAAAPQRPPGPEGGPGNGGAA